MFDRSDLHKRYRVHYRSLKRDVYDYDIGCERIHPWITSKWVRSIDEAIDIMNKVYDANPSLYECNSDSFRIEEAYILPALSNDEDEDEESNNEKQLIDKVITFLGEM